jgi:hypothetical protein
MSSPFPSPTPSPSSSSGSTGSASGLTALQQAASQYFAAGFGAGSALNQTTTSNKSSTIAKTTVDKKVYSSQQAKALAISAFQDAIGRMPTAKELNDFTAALNRAEASNKTITSGSVYTSRMKDTSTTGSATSRTNIADQTGTTSQSTTTKGGLDEVQFAKDYAMSLPDYSGYQKATNYFDAFLQTLNGPGGGVR